MPKDAPWSAEKYRLIGHIQRADSIEDITAIFQSLVTWFGFSLYSVFSIPNEMERSVTACITLTNGAPEFFLRYDALNDVPKNPVFCNLRRACNPLQWRLEDLGHHLDPPQRRALYGFLREFGIDAGIFFPVRSTFGPRRVVAFSGSRGKVEDGEIEELSLMIIQTVGRLNGLEMASGGGAAALTSLERDCLHRLVRNNETDLISKELGLCSRTVQYVVMSICRKLSVTGRQQAIAEARRLGIAR